MPEARPGDGGPVTRGNRLGIAFFKAALRLFGLRGTYGFLYFVCAYYAILDGPARRSAMPYVRHRFPGYGRLRRWFAVYLLFVNQGKHLLDRAYQYSGLGRLQLELLGQESLADMKGSGRGFILLTSHLGNWQAALAALGLLDRDVHLVMRSEDEPAVRAALGIGRPGARIKVISPEGFLGGVVDILKAIDSGAIVSIMGDRSYNKRSVRVDYLGEPASFPVGAFVVASSAACPVVVLLSAKTGARKYVVDVRNVLVPRFEKGCDRNARLREWVQVYVSIIEDYARRHPYQVFLFRDVWREP